MNILYKKSYCELCQNISCSDKGKRNIHFMDHNHCSRFTDGLIPKGFIKIPDGSYMEEGGNVRLVESFYISKYLVTVKEFCEYASWVYVNENANKPIASVDWEQATKYCKDMECRLPTQTEWCYACGENPDNLDDYGWYNENSNFELQEVGKKLPNSFGLYDMLGNIWELTSTIYHNTSNYIIIGGSCVGSKEYCSRNVTHHISTKDVRDLVGFRLVKNIK